MTFSLAARCAETGEFGMAISSSSPAVAARCLHLRAVVGAAASQNVTDPRLGPRLLDLLGAGADAASALATVRAETPAIEYRQLTVVDPGGGVAAFSGRHTLGVHAHVLGDGAVAAGNLLASQSVVAALLDGYTASRGESLPERLLDGLTAALAAGGEAGPVRSAGLVVVDAEAGWASTDLRVDWHDDPVGELGRLWTLWAPQRADYLLRGLDPARSPSYGVPGE